MACSSSTSLLGARAVASVGWTAGETNGDADQRRLHPGRDLAI
uniref:Uncharacterized protein n=1 Tax=Arundo donax TaxID=35708 RepID=A0A0A9BKU5_ARUDO